MLYANMGNENFDEVHIKCSRGSHLARMFPSAVSNDSLIKNRFKFVSTVFISLCMTILQYTMDFLLKSIC